MLHRREMDYYWANSYEWPEMNLTVVPSLRSYSSLRSNSGLIIRDAHIQSFYDLHLYSLFVSCYNLFWDFYALPVSKFRNQIRWILHVFFIYSGINSNYFVFSSCFRFFCIYDFLNFSILLKAICWIRVINKTLFNVLSVSSWLVWRFSWCFNNLDEILIYGMIWR